MVSCTHSSDRFEGLARPFPAAWSLRPQRPSASEHILATHRVNAGSRVVKIGAEFKRLERTCEVILSAEPKTHIGRNGCNVGTRQRGTVATTTTSSVFMGLNTVVDPKGFDLDALGEYG